MVRRSRRKGRALGSVKGKVRKFDFRKNGREKSRLGHELNFVFCFIVYDGILIKLRRAKMRSRKIHENL